MVIIHSNLLLKSLPNAEKTVKNRESRPGAAKRRSDLELSTSKPQSCLAVAPEKFSTDEHVLSRLLAFLFVSEHFGTLQSQTEDHHET